MKPRVLNLIEQSALDAERVKDYISEGISRNEAWEIVTVQRRMSLLAGMDPGPWRRELLTFFLRP